MKEIALVVDFRKRKAFELANEVKDWLEKKKNWSGSIEPLSDLGPFISRPFLYVITFGGDGTVLRAANAIASHNIPMARVNFGTVGYLCNIEPDKIFQSLEKILNERFRLESRTRIEAKILKEMTLVRSFDAFNEIVIGSTPEKKTTWLEAQVYDPVEHHKERLVKVEGDGLIIATKSGSTGYCLNAGGPALLEDVFAVVASNGYFEPEGFLPANAKCFVASCDVTIEITVLRGGSNLPCVVADSDRERTRLLKEGERVIIKRSPLKNLFIEF